MLSKIKPTLWWQKIPLVRDFNLFHEQFCLTVSALEQRYFSTSRYLENFPAREGLWLLFQGPVNSSSAERAETANHRHPAKRTNVQPQVIILGVKVVLRRIFPCPYDIFPMIGSNID